MREDLDLSEASHLRATFTAGGIADQYAVHSFEVEEALNRPYRARVRLIAREDATDGRELLEEEAVLAWGRGELHWRSVHGVVERVLLPDQRAAGLGVSALVEVTLVPALTTLSSTRDSRIFQGQTSLQVVSQLLNEELATLGREVDLECVDSSRLVPRDYCVQYQESKLDFIHRLLEEDGIGYRFEQPGPEMLVLFDDNQHLPDAPTRQMGPIRFDPVSRPHQDTEVVVEFAPSVQRGPSKLTARDLDWTRARDPILEHVTPLGDEGRSGPETEIYEHGLLRHQVIHEDAQLLGVLVSAIQSMLVPSGFQPPTDRVVNLPGTVLEAFTSSSLLDRSRVRAQALRRDDHTAGGASLAIGFSPGTRFTLTGHPALGADGDYYLTRVVHSGRTNEGEGASDFDEYHNRFECLPLETPWRPERRTPKPRIHSVQTAEVVGPVGMDVHTDSHGRVKLRFPWDRSEETFDRSYTCWVRVSQAWAGSGFPGFQFLPRVGMEVVVSFIDGDPDRPLVTGCVYNGQNPLPSFLPTQATKSIIRTRTIPHGVGYNELSFEDAMGRERVHLRAQRDLDELVLNDHLTNVLRSQANRVLVDHLEEVGEDQELRVHGTRTVLVGGAVIDECGGDRRSSVAGTDHQRVGGDYLLDVVEGPCVLNVEEGECVVLSKGAIRLHQNDERYVELTSEGEEAGITVHSKGSQIHVSENEITLTVGDSIIKVTPSHIRVNGKVFPSGGGGVT